MPTANWVSRPERGYKSSGAISSFVKTLHITRNCCNDMENKVVYIAILVMNVSGTIKGYIITISIYYEG